METNTKTLSIIVEEQKKRNRITKRAAKNHASCSMRR